MGRTPFKSGFPGGWNSSALSRRRSASSSFHRRLRIEPLESRHLLATLTVNTLVDSKIAGDGLVSLREAIIAANGNTTTDLGQTGSGADTIQFAANLSGTMSLVFGEMLITESITINGTGLNAVTIDGQNVPVIFRCTQATGSSTFSGLSLTHASEAAILSTQTYVVLNNCAIFANAIGLKAPTEAHGSIVRDNTGPGIWTYGNVTLTDGSVVSGNTGGGVRFRGSGNLVITDSTVTGNSVTGTGANGNSLTGGGVYVYNGDVTITRGTITGNSAGGAGGGLYQRPPLVPGGTLRMTIEDSVISGNTASNGGGVYANSQGAIIRRTTIANNTALYGNGGGFVQGSRPITVEDSIIRGNVALQNGGGLSNGNGATTLLRTQVFDNHSGGRGGGVYSGGNTTITSSSIRNNSATPSGSPIGGGLFAGNLTMISSDVSSNVGGGIQVMNNGNATLATSMVIGNGGIGLWGGNYTLQSSTVSGNADWGISGGNTFIYDSTVSQNGGGINSNNVSNSIVKRSTIVNNQTSNPLGAGIRANIIQLDRSIVAGNKAAGGIADVRPGVGGITVKSSLIGDNAGTSLAESHTPDTFGNLFGSSAGAGVIDPRVTALGNFGGPTLVHGLLPGSPALDAIPYVLGPTPLHFYELNGTLVDVFGGPSLVSLGGSLGSSAYQFGANQGLNLTSGTFNPAQYSIEILFKWTALSGGWQKIIDFHNLTTDVGLYTAVTGLEFSGRAFTPNVFEVNTNYQLTLTRDATTKVVRAYLNAVEIWNFVDTANEAVFDAPSHIVRFFQDDTVTGQSESQSGFVDRIRVYNQVLSQPQIAEILNPSEAPPQFDQRGTPFLRLVDADGIGGAQLDMGSYESQGVPHLSQYDYNEDGIVNTADFTVWRNTKGQTGLLPYSGADGNGDGNITQADYNLWKAHFGEVLTVTPAALGSGVEAVATPAAATAPTSNEPKSLSLHTSRGREQSTATDFSQLNLLSGRMTKQSLHSPEQAPSITSRESALRLWLSSLPQVIATAASRSNVNELITEVATENSLAESDVAPLDAVFASLI